MKVLAFTLSGRSAHFKKPEVNTYAAFTYNNIHKIALRGILGAIIGLRGYNDWNHKEEVLPEFYDKLQDIKCAIVPQTEHGIFSKKIQIFNNSVGYASQEEGGNLIIKEQWLEAPCWRIYVVVDSDIMDEIAIYLLEKKAKYVPYLGKNEHIADITDVVLMEEVQKETTYIQIDSLLEKEKMECGDFEDLEDYGIEDIELFKYEEALPVTFHSKTGMYCHKNLVLTNFAVLKYLDDVYRIEDKNIVFF